MISDGCKGINVLEKDYTELIFAVLNSSITRLSIEMEGRAEGAGDLQLMKNELEKILILDPRLLSPEEIQQILIAFEDYEKARNSGQFVTDKLQELDLAVLSALNLEYRINELYSSIAMKTNLRTGRTTEESHVID